MRPTSSIPAICHIPHYFFILVLILLPTTLSLTHTHLRYKNREMKKGPGGKWPFANCEADIAALRNVHGAKCEEKKKKKPPPPFPPKSAIFSICTPAPPPPHPPISISSTKPGKYLCCALARLLFPPLVLPLLLSSPSLPLSPSFFKTKIHVQTPHATWRKRKKGKRQNVSYETVPPRTTLPLRRGHDKSRIRIPKYHNNIGA